MVIYKGVKDFDKVLHIALCREKSLEGMETDQEKQELKRFICKGVIAMANPVTNSSSSFKNNSSILWRTSCSTYIFFSGEDRLRNDVRAILYFFGLLYCFIGLSAITARFFLGMENIVKHTREIVQRDPETGMQVVKREKVWNYTVADIALLAFGTSFPQISLATIDALQNIGQIYAGGLGPGTLVGSAACDLYLIHAICIVIPKGGTIKRISNLGVWVVELAWSLWAYIWLYIILQVWTPEVITTWEASMTVAQFFLLILHAYVQDQGWPFISIHILDQKKREDWVSAETSNSGAVVSAHSDCPPKSSAVSHDVNSTVESAPYDHLCLLDDFKSEKAGEDEISALIINPASSNKFHLNENEGYTWADTFMLWKRQFYDAISLKGSHDADKKHFFPTVLNTFWQLIMFPWRFMFALVPPYTIFHGWVTFICSLIFITGISYIVTKLTNLIGCVTGIKPYAIALTVLATGTSWPDLVASMIAAHRQATADSAIANITCSNSVNIFIGIGVPWVIDSFYNHFALNEQLRVPSVGLGFTLVLYFITFVLCIVILIARRYFFGGELGGPRKWAWASCAYILFLWLVFLVLSCLRVYNII